jgi:hypothetical protein
MCIYIPYIYIFFGPVPMMNNHANTIHCVTRGAETNVSDSPGLGR